VHKVTRAKDPYSIHMIRHLEDNHSKRGPTGDNRSDHCPVRCLDPHSFADMGEYLGIAHRHQAEFTEI